MFPLQSYRVGRAIVCLLIGLISVIMPFHTEVYADDSEEFLYNDNIYYQINNHDEIVITRSRATIEEANIPEEINGMPVTEIGVSAFQKKERLKSVSLPASVHTIGDYAFYQCRALETIEIPETVTYIGTKSFKETLWMKNQPEGCVILGNNIVVGFQGSTLEAVIPDGTTVIAGGAFENCTEIMSVQIPETVRNIGGLAFSGCRKLTECRIPDGVETLGEYAFNWCAALQKIDIADSVTSIGNHAFVGCTGLIQVDLPRNISRIETAVFQGCSSLSKIHLPSSVREIGNEAFYGCISLTEFSVRSTVISIGTDAFRNCSSLYKVSVYNEDCKIADSSGTIDTNAVIYGLRESTAQIYAQSYERQFVVIPYLAGDINGDTYVDISDATQVLAIYASMGSGTMHEPSEYEQFAGDINEDNSLDIADATEILRIYAENGAGM